MKDEEDYPYINMSEIRWATPIVTAILKILFA